MAFRDDASALIQQKKFDDFEALWMNQIESDPSDVETFIHVAKALRKAEQRTQSDTLLGLLSDALKERGLWGQRLQVLKEIGRLSKHPVQLRPAIEEALRKSAGTHKNFNRAFQFANFSDPQSNPVERAEKIETWLMYDEGECFFMNGRGAGVVTELNPELGVCRLDFEKEKRVSVPLGAAAKFLIPLPGGHVLREKFTNGDALKAAAKQSPADFFARLLQSFGRPMVMAEVRDAVIGIVPEEKWASWWTSARKNPQVVTSGTGAKATYAFAGSQSDAESVIRRDFDRADVKTKLDLAKKHSGRNQDLANAFASSLATEAARLSRTDAATAWQILTTHESLPGK
jgi:transcription elongation factor GreA-like protein